MRQKSERLIDVLDNRSFHDFETTARLNEETNVPYAEDDRYSDKHADAASDLFRIWQQS